MHARSCIVKVLAVELGLEMCNRLGLVLHRQYVQSSPAGLLYDNTRGEHPH